jgi:hypothetical protein
MSLLLRRVVVLLLVAIPSLAVAHPGVSIVADSRGNVFYTDLKHVWRIDPSGAKSVAVPNVHTHELVLDSADNLYGEHLWYEGERTNKWGHRVWRRSPDGRVVDIIPARDPFPPAYGFVRDRAGNMYWADRDRSQIVKKSPDGRTSTLARAPFRDVRWMTATPEGVVYLIDYHDLIRIDPDGKFRFVARQLSSGRLGGRHALMGLWTDGGGNVYIAAHADRQVKRVTPRGDVSVVQTSRFPWSVTGGTFAPNGDLWLLEYSTDNRARARRISRDGRERTY